MKGMKKLLSILMVLTLVLSLGAMALADGPLNPKAAENGTVTVDTKPTNDKEEHTYKFYRIFTGSQATEPDDNAPLGNIEWGEGINSETFLPALKADTEIGSYFTDCNTAADVAEVLGVNVMNEALAKQFAAIAAKHLGTATETKTVGDEGSTTVTIPIGYYLVVDETAVEGKQTAKNESMLQVTGSVHISNKYDVPSSDKYVQDTNDTSDADISDNDWEKTADHDIGDKVPFKLEATIPAGTTDNYTTYELTFHDSEEKGLTYQKDAKAYLNGVEINSSKYTVTAPGTDGCTFDVHFDDIKSLDGFKDDVVNVITVEYTSELNADAVIGNNGNHNKMHIDFSNDYTKDTKGETPDVTVVVFTYDLNVDKVDQDNKPLAGAEFKLYKVDQNGTIDPSTIDQLKDISELTGKMLTEVTLTKDTDGDSFYGKGLDDGDYWIIETVTPPGYNTIDPKNFTVTAEHGDLVTKLEGTGDFNFTLTRAGGEGDAAEGQADIKNQQGPVLPETGGIGTTIFYIAGAVLVAGAVILLVTKKRVSGMEK